MNIAPAPTPITTATDPHPARRARRSLLVGLCLGICALLAPSADVLAGPPAAQNVRPGTSAPGVPPKWEQLSAEQREAVITLLRDRWNANPGQRARMLEHARRWQTMTPEQRRLAERGLSRWSRMSPEERAKARQRFHARGDGMTSDQRRTLRETLREMTPEQRREWLRRKRAERHNSAPANTSTAPDR